MSPVTGELARLRLLRPPRTRRPVCAALPGPGDAAAEPERRSDQREGRADRALQAHEQSGRGQCVRTENGHSEHSGTPWRGDREGQWPEPVAVRTAAFVSPVSTLTPPARVPGCRPGFAAAPGKKVGWSPARPPREAGAGGSGPRRSARRGPRGMRACRGCGGREEDGGGGLGVSLSTPGSPGNPSHMSLTSSSAVSPHGTETPPRPGGRCCLYSHLHRRGNGGLPRPLPSTACLRSETETQESRSRSQARRSRRPRTRKQQGR